LAGWSFAVSLSHDRGHAIAQVLATPPPRKRLRRIS
jgi:hypothetical protein